MSDQETQLSIPEITNEILEYARDRAFWEMPIKRHLIEDILVKHLNTASLTKTIEELQARLIERTEASVQAGVRDMRVILELQEQLRLARI